ncbi:hypothetical protein NOR_06999 [Metarhizium rileyi]|uniref:Protamine P1 n=1 Tax=Metarhizium rileyi (strain RCEF 4871) TaxID=1649241 RepID=A0A166Z779_METRR|nr:hypothetical protein NOR_06999 [Metarhizium rileyi RCEF 4871]
MSTELNEIWGNDTVYSGSFCPPEHVLYEGSEDDEYESPATRRRRYDEAGKRFLEGTAPVLLSAALRGPFDRCTGFVNPWMSSRDRGISCSPSPPSRPIEKTVSQKIRSMHKLKQEHTLQAPSVDCHLPSPESLKQAPYTQHPYLKADELEKVDKWREQVDPAASAKQDFWVHDTTDAPTSIKRRRVSGSEWLKKVSVKKQRSAMTLEWPHRQVQEDGEVDELMTDIPSSSFVSIRRVISPTKWRSPRNATRRTSGKGLVESDDDLSPNKAAAATLSSPVSLRNDLMVSPLKTNQPQNHVISSVGTQTTLSRLQPINLLDNSSHTESVQQENQPGEGHSAKSQDAKEESSDDSIDTISETHHNAEFQLKTLSNEADDFPDIRFQVPRLNVSRACEDAPVKAIDDQHGSEGYELVPSPPALDVKSECKPQSATHKAGLDNRVQDVFFMQSESRSVEQCAFHSSTQAHAESLHDTTPDDSPVTGLEMLMTQSRECNVVDIESINNSVAPESSANLTVKDDHDFEMNAKHDSGDKGTTVQKTLSLCDNEPDPLRNTNHSLAPGDMTEGSGKPDCMTLNSRKMSSTNDEERGSEPCKLGTPAAPRQTGSVKDASEFRLKSALNRSVPSSPWSKLTRLAGSTAPSPSAVFSKYNTAMNACTDQLEERPGAQHSWARPGSVSSPRYDELTNEQGHLHESDQIQQRFSSSQGKTPCMSPEVEDHRVPESQQSPWVDSDHMLLSKSALGTPSPNVSGVKPVMIEGEKTAAVSTPDMQSPWAQNTSPIATIFRPLSSSSSGSVVQTLFVKPSLPRSGTPEPQFCVKSFSSFMSPSPDRNRGDYGPPSTFRPSCRGSKGSLPSSLKTCWSQQRSDLHVSWAASLVEFEKTPPSQEDVCATRHIPKRQSSPPPETPVGEEQGAYDTKFAKHFAAVANRKDGHSQPIIPTEWQQLRSPGPFAMAETFMAADTNARGVGPKNGDNAALSEPFISRRASEEPMDVVEDMVREMGDFWDTWNIDAELDQARNGASDGTAPVIGK